ncbi:MAG: RNA 2',3'-cyclic phosphodiesterase [Clostridia bacterium]|nr:RNA 2',3'-cyclic phosphodiesterase [Clostridia bacterium]
MRLFFGLSLPEDVRRAAHARALALCEHTPGRYVPPENYHITLAFLGDVPQERLRDAQEVLARCIRSLPAPRMTLGDTGYFGRAQNAILIIRVQAEPELSGLHERLVRELLAAGLPADPGPFSPHITLARHARIGALPAGNAPSFTAGQAHVFLSARDEGGVLRYTPLCAAAFAAHENSP